MRFVRFGIVGILNTAVDWAVLGALLFIFGQHDGLFSYPTYKAISFSAAVLNSYIFNTRWVFRDRAQETQRLQLFKFSFVSAVGLFINVTAASSFVSANLCGARFVVCAYIGAFLGTIAAFVWNYIGYQLFVFKK